MNEERRSVDCVCGEDKKDTGKGKCERRWPKDWKHVIKALEILSDPATAIASVQLYAHVFRCSYNAEEKVCPEGRGSFVLM